MAYITGSAEDRANFGTQLEYLYKRRGLVIVGSFGRAALYASFGWETPPLHLRVLAESVDSELRDIDIVTPRRLHKSADYCGPHTVEAELNQWFAQTDNPGVINPTVVGEPQTFPVDPGVLKPHTRSLEGQRVHTFTVGTMQAFQHFVAASSKGISPHHAAALREFDTFADAVRTTHPQEFHPDELYQPFRDAAAVTER